jgi:hypothetical protein
MLAGKRVVFRVAFSGHYAEGIFSFDQIHFARPAFRKALPQIRQLSTR